MNDDDLRAALALDLDDGGTFRLRTLLAHRRRQAEARLRRNAGTTGVALSALVTVGVALTLAAPSIGTVVAGAALLLGAVASALLATGVSKVDG